ncbi:hypothetical protein HQ560_20195 [bacterium]|nr:hypothetical protein [bacterium]
MIHQPQRCSCQTHACTRRSFLAATMASPLLLGRLSLGADAPPVKKQPAVIRAAFVYPPSAKFKDNPDGWWSWPGNEFDAEARQKQYIAAFRTMEKELGVSIVVDDKPVSTNDDVAKLSGELKEKKPDGLLLVMLYNRSRKQAETLLKAAEAEGIPSIFYVGLGVMHGSIDAFLRPGLHFIQSLDNMPAIANAVRMIHARKAMAQSLLLSITEAPKRREGVEKFFGTTVRVIPFKEYADLFGAAAIDAATRGRFDAVIKGATERRGVTDEAVENAMKADIALRKLLAQEGADGLTMNCLRRGMLKPCMSFSALNGELIPAACENDFGALYTQRLGQLLTGRPGFQHNPAFETEKNHYYASHCTCATKLHGPEGGDLPYLVRRFAHTNEGSCAIQVFWKGGDPVTMVRYYAGKPPALSLYAGKVVVSHPMPPAGGCTTNVEVEITDRKEAREVRGHHNLLFCGDFSKRFKQFANLYRMRVT